MISIDWADFEHRVAYAIAVQEDRCVIVFKSLAYRVFNYAVRETPEWTGNAAGNWRIGVNGESSVAPDAFPGWKVGQPVFTASSPNIARVQRALGVARSALSGDVKLTDVLFMSNRSVEDGVDVSRFTTDSSYFRPGNQPSDVFPRAVSYGVSQPLLTGLIKGGV